MEKGWEETRTRRKKKKRNRRKQQQRRNPASDNCFCFLSRVQNETPSHYVRFDLLLKRIATPDFPKLNFSFFFKVGRGLKKRVDT
ncbi:MAG: hypothetical protein NTU69_10070 [Proteobacteria bacterium]|nr:hypothetical protein [Pseudomonadota bacterium]